MTEPTSQDIANAELRAAISARQKADYALALALAASVFGSGWVPTGRHYLVAHAEADRCRKTGERPQPAATVYTAEKGWGRRHFMVTGGVAREVESYQAGFGAMLTEPDPDRTIVWGGKTVHLHRYGLYWAGYEPDYRPKSADELAAARERREAKAVEKEAEGTLFADLIREEGYVKKARKK